MASCTDHAAFGPSRSLASVYCNATSGLRHVASVALVSHAGRGAAPTSSAGDIERHADDVPGQEP